MDSKNRYLELDALRGIAALSVVFFHFSLYKTSGYVFKFGSTGVDLFFIISGFVIFMTLEKTKTWKDFLISRFSRLYPTYWTCVTLTTIVILFAQKIHFLNIYKKYLANMTMFQVYFKVGHVDNSYWTMLLEMLFYFYMFIIYCCNKLKSIRIIGFLTLIPVFIYSTPFFKNHFSRIHGIIEYWLPVAAFFPLFFAGIIFYKLKNQKPQSIDYFLLIICLVCQLSLFDDGGKSNIFISLEIYTFILCVYFVLFLLFVQNKLKFIVNKVTIFLGNISFSIYLIHQYIGTNLLIPFFLKLNDSFILSSLLSTLIIILLAYLITRFIERPSIHYLRLNYEKWKYQHGIKPYAYAESAKLNIANELNK